MREQLTESDVKKIQEEIDHRKLVVRKEAIEAVKEARAQGDLSENFEYYAAKKEKNKNESRIRYLERMLKTAKIVTDTTKSDEVGLNNIVEIYFEEDDFDKFAEKLKECDVEYVHSVKEHSWGQRAVRFYDPDKHIIEVGENLQSVCKRFLDSGMTAEEVAKRMDVPIRFVNSCI